MGSVGTFIRLLDESGRTTNKVSRSWFEGGEGTGEPCSIHPLYRGARTITEIMPGVFASGVRLLTPECKQAMLPYMGLDVGQGDLGAVVYVRDTTGRPSDVLEFVQTVVSSLADDDRHRLVFDSRRVGEIMHYEFAVLES